MPRTRCRVCLQDGLKLDLNRLARKEYIKFGVNIGVRGIVWKHSYWGEIARGIISADMTDPHDSWLGVQIGERTQRITLIPNSDISAGVNGSLSARRLTGSQTRLRV